MKSYFLEFKQPMSLAGIDFRISELARIEAPYAADVRAYLRKTLTPQQNQDVQIRTILPSRPIMLVRFPHRFKPVPGCTTKLSCPGTFFITFGSHYTHTLRDGTTLDKNCQGQIDAWSFEEAYDIADFMFGQQFVNVYDRPRAMKFYPDGVKLIKSPNNLGAPVAAVPPKPDDYDDIGDTPNAQGAAVPQDEFGIKSDPNYDYMKSIKDFIG